MKRELIGCIADDFTGASDVCSFLIESGANCILINEIPKIDLEFDEEIDVIVVALKIRTAPLDETIEHVKQAASWLEKKGATRIYDKYCSTFDSTSEGNIGPILDYLMERYQEQYTLVSPALPTNKREVFNGYLFADGVLLSESSMKDHPLTPMTDSYLPRLLESQSKYKCYRLDLRMLESNKKEIIEYSNALSNDEHYYIVPDYINDNHGKKLVETFADLKILSGGSSLINEWYKCLMPEGNESANKDFSKGSSPTLILSGSLSLQTRRQLKSFIDTGGKAIRINKDIINKDKREEMYRMLDVLQDDILLYSSKEESFDTKDTQIIANEIETFFSDMAKYAMKIGIKKIIAAGGETSGSIISQLDFSSFIIEQNVAPGVPILRPTENRDIQIVLKSGNFGKDDFFNSAISLMKGE